LFFLANNRTRCPRCPEKGIAVLHDQPIRVATDHEIRCTWPTGKQHKGIAEGIRRMVLRGSKETVLDTTRQHTCAPAPALSSKPIPPPAETPFNQQEVGTRRKAALLPRLDSSHDLVVGTVRVKESGVRAPIGNGRKVPVKRAPERAWRSLDALDDLQVKERRGFSGKKRSWRRGRLDHNRGFDIP